MGAKDLFKMERNQSPKRIIARINTNTNIHVDIVKHHLGLKVTGKYMNEFTLVRNHIHVNIVKKHFRRHKIGINMNEFTLERSHLDVQCATDFLMILVTCIAIVKEGTNEESTGKQPSTRSHNLI